MSMAPLIIGDKVRLNARGYETINYHRLRDPNERKAANDLLVISRVSEYEPVPGVWDIDVEGPLNHYLLTSADVYKISVTIVRGRLGLTTIIAQD